MKYLVCLRMNLIFLLRAELLVTLFTLYYLGMEEESLNVQSSNQPECFSIFYKIQLSIHVFMWNRPRSDDRI